MKPMMVLLPLALVAGDACAQRVYKCNDSGRSVYQSLPCPAAQDTGIQRPIVRDPRLTAADVARVEREARDARQPSGSRALRHPPVAQGTVIQAATDAEACEQARSRRELAGWFGSRTPTRQLDEDVNRACAWR